MDLFLNILFGFLGGIFGGLGMGGGTILIPLLTIFLSFEQKLAQGINLVSFLVMALLSLIIHSHNGLIEKRGLLYIILPGIFSSIAGAILAGLIAGGTLRIIFGVFLILLSIIQIIKVFKK